MNFSFTITAGNEAEGRKDQHLDLPPIKTKKVKIQPENNQDWEKRQRPKYVKNAWNKAEKKKYIAFLRKNEHLFSYTLVQRKRQKINVMMSQAVKSRTAAKCHSYHQKMMLKFGTIQNIIKCYVQQSRKKRSMDTSSSTESEEVIIEDKIEENQIIGQQQYQYSYREPLWMQYINMGPAEQFDTFIRIQSQQQ